MWMVKAGESGKGSVYWDGRVDDAGPHFGRLTEREEDRDVTPGQWETREEAEAAVERYRGAKMQTGWPEADALEVVEAGGG